jgi:hypothetical protein
MQDFADIVVAGLAEQRPILQAHDLLRKAIDCAAVGPTAITRH